LSTSVENELSDRYAGGEVEIRPVTVREIHDFARRAVADRERIGVVPVSLARARAWQSNPYAKAEDVALLVAWQEEQCVGYFGLLPGRLRIGDRVETVHWSSTFYVAEEFRHTCASIRLLQEAVGLQRHLFVTGFSPKVGEFYEAFGFKPLGPLSYWALELPQCNPLGVRFRSLRSRRRKNGRTDSPWLDRLVLGSDWVFKKLAYALLRRRSARVLRRWETRRAGRIPDRPAIQSPDVNGRARFVRDADAINWMLTDHWYTTRVEERTEGYYFDDWCRVHEYRAVEIHRKTGGSPCGWAVLRLHATRRHRSLMVCDYDLSDPDVYGCLAALAVREGGRMLADSIVLPDACADAASAWPLLRRLIRRKHRAYYWYPQGNGAERAAISRDVQLSLADGDMAF